MAHERVYAYAFKLSSVITEDVADPLYIQGTIKQPLSSSINVAGWWVDASFNTVVRLGLEVHSYEEFKNLGVYFSGLASLLIELF
jgi:hypothetical protein